MSVKVRIAECVLVAGKVGAAMLLMVSASWAGTIRYSYDDLNRLAQVEYSDGALIRYTYDAAGNRLTMVVGGVIAQGDVNGDGEVNIEDIFGAIRCTFDPSLAECVNPDCTGNGEADIEDVFCVIRCSFGECPG